MKSAIFQWIVGGFIVLAVVGTIVSAIAVVRSTRRRTARASGTGSAG